MTPFPNGFKPMKGDSAEVHEITFPCLASPKIDGFRCIVGRDGVAYGAALEPIPNAFVQDYFKRHANSLAGLDGELIVGDPKDPEVFRKGSGSLKRKHGEPDFTFWVFDDWIAAENGVPYQARAFSLGSLDRWLPERAIAVPEDYMTDALMLSMLVSRNVSAGYEGTMVRSPDGPYKYGRSTLREGYLLKIKEFEDDEAEILELIEAQENTNAAEKDALGRTKRSSAKAGKVGKGTLGSFRVRVLTGRFKGQETTVSTGTLTKEERAALWAMWLSWTKGFTTLFPAADVPSGFDANKPPEGQVVTFKHMKHSGGYDKPRHAGFKCFRPSWDRTE